jgi:16S rRNA (cytidine1402-2'-O)-methyltransferase
LAGTLYIVATPLGNLEDITLRAVRTLREAHVIAAEDTRHTLKLLNHLGISGTPLVSYWGEKEKARADEVMRRLRGGEDVALVSDAGTPGISDPGAVLVRAALDEGIEVIPIPGPSAVATALSVSGLDTREFTFVGFLPAKQGPRSRALEELSLEPRTLVFYESPHRIIDMLIDLEKAFGPDRPIALCKELTKIHETIYRGTAAEVLDLLEEGQEMIAGEYVVLAGGKPRMKGAMDEALAEMAAVMKRGMGRKEASKRVSGQYGLKKKDLYDTSLRMDQEDEEEEDEEEDEE